MPAAPRRPTHPASPRRCPAARSSVRSPVSPPLRRGAAGQRSSAQQATSERPSRPDRRHSRTTRRTAPDRCAPRQAREFRPGLAVVNDSSPVIAARPTPRSGSGCVAKYRRSSAILALRDGVKTRRSSSSAKAIMAMYVGARCALCQRDCHWRKSCVAVGCPSPLAATRLLATLGGCNSTQCKNSSPPKTARLSTAPTSRSAAAEFQGRRGLGL